MKKQLATISIKIPSTIDFMDDLGSFLQAFSDHFNCIELDIEACDAHAEMVDALEAGFRFTSEPVTDVDGPNNPDEYAPLMITMGDDLVQSCPPSELYQVALTEITTLQSELDNSLKILFETMNIERPSVLEIEPVEGALPGMFTLSAVF